MADVIEDLTLDLESRADGLIQTYNVSGLARPKGSYKHITAIRLGPKNKPEGYELRIAGMVPQDGEGCLVGETAFAQTRQVIGNIAIAIQGAVTHYGANLGRQAALWSVVDSTVFLTDLQHWSAVNEAYRAEGFPLVCRAAIAAKEVPFQGKGGLMEIRANAIIPV